MKTPRQNPPNPADRKDRLKAALKANIAKRKDQAKSRQLGDAAASRDAAPAPVAAQTEAKDD